MSTKCVLCASWMWVWNKQSSQFGLWNLLGAQRIRFSYSRRRPRCCHIIAAIWQKRKFAVHHLWRPSASPNHRNNVSPRKVIRKPSRLLLSVLRLLQFPTLSLSSPPRLVISFSRRTSCYPFFFFCSCCRPQLLLLFLVMRCRNRKALWAKSE